MWWMSFNLMETSKKWVCSQCTLKNLPSSVRCLVCGARKKRVIPLKKTKETTGAQSTPQKRKKKPRLSPKRRKKLKRTPVKVFIYLIKSKKYY